MSIVAANWKMNGVKLVDSFALVRKVTDFVKKNKPACDVVIFPPFTMLGFIKEELYESGLKLGAQDCHFADNGAYTGDISSAMIKELGCEYVIVGHSERRSYHSETNDIICKKAESAHKHGIKTIICVGESIEERKKGKVLKILKKQVTESLPSGTNSDNTIIAYEPIWAIGTGVIPKSEEIAEAHEYINKLSGLKVIYGGSVKAANAKDLSVIKGVEGMLVGGASLDANEFCNIIGVYVNG